MAKADRAAVLRNTSDCKTEEDLLKLATAIRNMFPSGKMSDNITYWRQNPKDISNKLIKFFADYDDHYTYDEIVEATSKYIRSFSMKPNHTGMRCSKYFVMKFDKVSGEFTSDLSTALEQLRDSKKGNNENSVGDDWVNTLV